MAAHFGSSNGLSLNYGGIAHGQQSLPSGACNFRELAGAASATTCGCRRFWLHNQNGDVQDADAAWCFCGHHACFHEDIGSSGGSALKAEFNAVPTSQPLFTQRDATEGNVFAVPRPVTSAGTRTGQSLTGLGIREPQPSQEASVSTRLYRALTGMNAICEFGRNQEDRVEGRYSDTSSGLPSTRVPSVNSDARASPARAMREYQQRFHAMGPPVNVPTGLDREVRFDEYSATEVATPSIRGTPDFRAATAPPPTTEPHIVETVRPSTSQPEPTAPIENFLSNPVTTQRDFINGVSMSPLEMANTIRDFGRRLDMLENLSFPHMPIGEVEERFELIDGRLIDLETWRRDRDIAAEAAEAAKRQESEEPPKHRRLLPTESGSFASDGSYDSNAAVQTEAVVLATLAASAEIRPSIDALEFRVAELESAALPSFSRPWHIQVVILPFGRLLPGIWFSSHESTQQSMQPATANQDEWGGVEDTTGKTSFRSSGSAAWTTESIQAWANEARDEWLLPKACGPNGIVFQRLESRGLIRDVKITSPDARHISRTIYEAFDDVLSRDDELVAEAIKKYGAFREHYIPLRKVRKSARLRFLSPSEMATPALWTAGFLESSVFMKTDEGRRLYMTVPAGYLQPHGSHWSWPMIKSLPMAGADRAFQAARDGGSVIESCWTYHDRLDRIDNLDSSFAEHESVWSTRSQNSARSSEFEAAQRSSDDYKRIQAVPVPRAASQPGPSIEPLGKRRVASYETTTTVSASEFGSDAMIKRRRLSDSPELERRGVNFTPRWSREPPSPYTHDDPAGIMRSQVTILAAKRGITPTAYATPHSHFDSSRAGEGDTEPDTEVPVARSEHGDDDPEEWEGVQDDPSAVSPPEALRPIVVDHEISSDDDDNNDGEDDDDDDDDDDDLEFD